MFTYKQLEQTLEPDILNINALFCDWNIFNLLSDSFSALKIAKSCLMDGNN